jgi:hypothetical protein
MTAVKVVSARTRTLTFIDIALRAGQWAMGNSEEKRLPDKGLSDLIFSFMS